MFEIISKKGLDNLKYYKYAGEDHSVLVKLFLKRFWDWVVTLFPMWIAPNVITLLGFMCIWTNFFTLAYYAPNLQEVAPTWVYVSFAAGIFIYQVMDNIDGKQARRTQSSSPLGELFDHGCDSLFVTISGITICSAIHCGTWQSWLMINIGTFPFYLSHWEEYHSGILILGKVGNPTEAQLLMIAIHLLAALLSPLFFAQTLGGFLASFGLTVGGILPSFIANITLNWIVMFASSMASLCLVVADNFKVVYNHNKKTNGSFVKSLLMLIPFFLHIFSTYTWFRVSKAHVLENHLILSIVFYGVVISYMLNRMMIDRITKIPHNPWNFVSLFSTIGMLGALFGTAEQEETLLYVLFGVLTVIYTHMVLMVVHQLTNHLGIYCFSVAKPKAK